MTKKVMFLLKESDEHAPYTGSKWEWEDGDLTFYDVDGNVIEEDIEEKDFKGHAGIPGHLGGSLAKGQSAPKEKDEYARLQADRINTGKKIWIAQRRISKSEGKTEDEARADADAARAKFYAGWDKRHGAELEAAKQARKDAKKGKTEYDSLMEERKTGAQQVYDAQYAKSRKAGYSEESSASRAEMHRDSFLAKWDADNMDRVAAAKAALGTKKPVAKLDPNSVEELANQHYQEFDEIRNYETKPRIRSLWTPQYQDTIAASADKYGAGYAADSIDSWTHKNGSNKDSYYTAQRNMAEILRKGTTPGADHPAHMDLLNETEVKAINTLTDVLDRSNIPQNTVSYRGLKSYSKTAQVILNKKVGESFDDKAFVSTALERTAGLGFANEDGVFLRIRVPKGSKGVFTAKSQYENEVELLLQRDSRFVVLGKKKIKNSAGENIWQVDVLLQQPATHTFVQPFKLPEPDVYTPPF